MNTLARCAASKSDKAKILEKSTKIAAQREGILAEAIQTQDILVKTKNVCYHVMQPHHHWEKVVALTGNIEEDFKKVVSLLEDNHLLNKTHIHETVRRGPVVVTEYRMTINGSWEELGARRHRGSPSIVFH